MIDEPDGLALVQHAITQHKKRIACVSSFGAESAVLLDLVASVDRSTRVIFLNTGRMFPETLSYQIELCQYLGLNNIEIAGPCETALSRQDPHGGLAQTDPDSCCYLRKTEPLETALSGYDAWINGRKRFQGGSRASLPVIEHDHINRRIKYNPLAHWTVEDIRHYRRLRQLPLHPLVKQGFASIGCMPCTSKTAPGEPPRAGRWRGLEKAECGIHQR